MVTPKLHETWGCHKNHPVGNQQGITVGAVGKVVSCEGGEVCLEFYRLSSGTTQVRVPIKGLTEYMHRQEQR